jgi:hypothetical protein
MALHEEIGRGAKKLVVPAAASLAGAGAGLALTRKSVRKSMPDLGELGDLAGDLKTKLESVIGKTPLQGGDGGRSTSSQGRRIEPRELDRRLREREQRRSARRARS